LFDSGHVTEASWVLRGKLSRAGFQVHEHDLCLAPLSDVHADVIACLNVLDRCLRPRSLLTHLRAMLAPSARLLLSVPLPLRPHVHVGPRTADPEEALPRSDDVWELDANALVEELLAPLGFQVERLSRVPYLSRGDVDCPVYVLDAALLVLRAA
jgi:SAM-dependent methyltransferase